MLINAFSNITMALHFQQKDSVPGKLIYTEAFPDRIDARKKEKYLKSGIGKEFLKSIVRAIPGN